MLDLIEILGEENFLSQMIGEQRGLFYKSLCYDARELALKAKIPPRVSSADKYSSYTGKAFCLKFQANLPEGHEHFWKAEVLIGDMTAEKNDVPISDDEIIPIFIYGNADTLIPEGDLNLMGLSLAVHEGRTSCTLGDLRNSLTRKKVFFTAPGYGIVHGHLTF